MHAELYISFFKTPWGTLEVKHDEHFIYRSLFTQNQGTRFSHSLADLIQMELEAYFTNPHHRFQLPLKPQGSMYGLRRFCKR